MANPLAGAAVPTVAVTPPATLDALPRGVSEEAGHVVFLETTSHTWLGANFPSWRRKSVKFYYQLQADMPGKIDVPITLYSHLIAKMLDKGCAGCVHRVWIFEPRLAGGGGVHAPPLPIGIPPIGGNVVLSTCDHPVMVALRARLLDLSRRWSFFRQGQAGGLHLARAAAALHGGHFARGLTLFMHGISLASGYGDDADMLGTCGELFDFARYVSCSHIPAYPA